MGAPKQKWTAEEEEALRAGVRKHGAGKWQTILRDPEFNQVLHSRSNVDLKDKWRNINVMASGFGSREKARLAMKRISQAPVQDVNAGTSSNLVQGDEKPTESKPHSVSPTGDKVQVAESKKSFTRLESVILEAITTMKEPKGSDKIAISAYIEANYNEPPDFKKLLSANLKLMTSNGKLVKAKHRYKLALSSSPCQSRTNSMNGKQEDVYKVEKNGIRIFTQPEVDADLNMMRHMSAHEAAAAAARAVVEAEAAIAEAERAAREAEAAEAEAEAAQIFADTAINAYQKLSVY